MSKVICIISCGKQKYWDARRDDLFRPLAIPAKSAYTGPLFRKCADYAEKTAPGNWYILSDKYGLIPPNQLIEDYDISPEEVKNNELFIKLVEFQTYALNLRITDQVITTCGKIHVIILERIFTHAKIIQPLEGLDQGLRMKRLKEMID